MLQLRIQQHAVAEGRHRIEISLEGSGARRTAESTFPFSLSPQDEEDLRWYLEDFLQYPQEPAPAIAQRIEARLAEVGAELFRAVFQGSDDARDLWAELRRRLPETRVEIVTSVAEAATLPWELLRDPKTEAPLALTARSFVRAQPNAALTPSLPAKKKGKIRILLVLCRPQGGQDVPFRSVASRLIKGLSEANREAYDLDLLRPSTFEQLGRVLRKAHGEGRPYHVVHFDGHGTYMEVPEPGALGGLLGRFTPFMLAGPRTGQHGYLVFENPKIDDNGELVDGTTLGQLLAATGVSLLVLNACRSAHTEPAPGPSVSEAAADPHSQVRAFGSLAQEVMDAGVAGVLAMRYNVYVVTAAQFVAELYAALGRGGTFGEAATLARKNLADNPLRTIAFSPLSLQDWTVPVVYEAAPLQLFPKSKGDGGLKIEIAAGDAVTSSASLDKELPPPPDAGFYGRDETLLALDRAFDRDQIVLLHAYAGSGKTTTAAEFARWYSLTGGTGDGPVLFTTFERYLPLPRVLDRVGQVFGPALEGAGVHWLALDDDARRHVTLQVLTQMPVLWIWDNVEPVAGFPAGTESAWSAEEREELLNFLRDLRGTQAKILLTSRRDEQGWLGGLPTRIAVPPMPTTEGLQLVSALAAKHGHRLTEVEDWRPLLAFAQGNPLTLTVLAGQALRAGWRTRAQIETFVARLRSGEAAFPDEAAEGRSRSLGASLAYGFEQAFSEEERHRLALLHLFQGFVDVDVLTWMGDPKRDWCLPEVHGMTREEGIALLDRAAEVGLLETHGGGYYRIHPALPWFFSGLFERSYSEGGLPAVRAFVRAVGVLGVYCHRQYEQGNRGVIKLLQAEEENLLQARRLARAHRLWEAVISSMQGLDQLYDHTGRRAEWKRLVEEIVPNFVDSHSDGPLPGHEEWWSQVTAYRVRLARAERQWAEAERLQTVCVDWDRRRAASALGRAADAPEVGDWNRVQTLAASLHDLGQIRRELGQAECVPAYEETLELAVRIGERSGAASSAFNLGNAFMGLPVLRDLARAELWYRRSLDFASEADRLGRGRIIGQLGSVAHLQFIDARAAGRPAEELLQNLNKAANLYQEAFALFPSDAVGDLAIVQNQLGALYGDAGDLDRALSHYREAIRYDEQQGDLYGAAQSRFNVALAFLHAGRGADALEYAEAALRGFENYGDRASEDAEDSRRLVAEIRGA